MRKLKKKVFFSVLGLGSFAVVASTVTAITLTMSKNKSGSNDYLNSFGDKVVTSPKSLEQLRNSDSSDVAKLEKFDSRNYNIVTPVKTQESSELDYAYSAIAASEISILKKGVVDSGIFDYKNFDLSEKNLNYVVNNRTKDADKLGLTSNDIYTSGTGFHKKSISDVAKVLLQQNAPILETDVYDYYGKPIVLLENAVNVLPNGLYVHDSANPNFFQNVKKLKQAIANYGAVTVTYNDNGQTSSEYFASHDKDSSESHHSATIVGWDDSISYKLFNKNGADGVDVNGAWIVKDSRGTQWGKDGYFYLSYQSDLNEIYAFDYVNKDLYQNSYYYDGLNTDFVPNDAWTKNNDTSSISAIFNAKKASNSKKEYLRAVNFGLAKGNQNIVISVRKLNKNVVSPNNVYGSLDYPLQGELIIKVESSETHYESPGFYTYVFDKQIELEQNYYYSVELKSISGVDNPFVLSYENNSTNDLTYVLNKAGNKYVNTGANGNGAVARIKAFTVTGNVAEPAPLIDIRNAEFTVSDYNYVYAGNAKTPSVSVRLNGELLTPDVDYRLFYSNNVNAGKAGVKVVGINKYFGVSDEFAFQIERASNKITNFEIDKNNKIVMSSLFGNPYVKYFKDPECKNEVQSSGLVLGNKYYIKAYADWNPNYFAAESKNALEYIYVNNNDISSDSWLVEREGWGGPTYTGSEIRPAYTIKLASNLSDSPSLIEGIDYVAYYSNNINAGTARVDFYGIGNYVGHRVCEFWINKAVSYYKNINFYVNDNNEIILSNDIVIDGDKSFFEYADCSLDNDGNVNHVGAFKRANSMNEMMSSMLAGHTYAIFIWSKGDKNVGSGLMNKKALYYTHKADIGRNYINVSLESYNYEYTGEEHRPKVIVESSTHQKLVEGVDYDVFYQNNVNAGTAKVVVVGKTEFVKGSRIINFEIAKARNEIEFHGTDYYNAIISVTSRFGDPHIKHYSDRNCTKEVSLKDRKDGVTYFAKGYVDETANWKGASSVLEYVYHNYRHE